MAKDYFSLCNTVLRELFNEEASTFSDLDTTTEGKLVKQKLNLLNTQICIQEKDVWTFRQKMQYLYMIDGQQEYDAPNGYILSIRPTIYPSPLIYNPNWVYLPNSSGRPIQYWIYNDKINVFPTPNTANDGFELKVYYLTNNCAIDNNGVEKESLEDETDISIIPEEYRDVLVYGVCKDWKRSKGDQMSEFYRDKYNEIYRSMLSTCERTNDNPSGFDMMGRPLSITESSLSVFYNPRAGGDYSGR